MKSSNKRNCDFYYTVVFMLVIGVIAIVVGVYNWSDFTSFGRTICSIVAGAAIYISAITLIEGFTPGLMGYTCPRCGGPVGRAVASQTDDLFHMLLISIFSAFATFGCGKCGPIRGSELPLASRIMAVLRSLRWLAMGALVLGAIVGAILFASASSHH